MSDFDDVDDLDDTIDDVDYETPSPVRQKDVRRKIEEILERKRLRQELGEFDDF